MALRKTNPTRCLIIESLENFIRKYSKERDLKSLEQTVRQLRSSRKLECSTHKLQQIIEPQTLFVVGKILRGNTEYTRSHEIFCFEISAGARAQLDRSASTVHRLDHTLDESQIEHILASNPRMIL